MKKDSLACEYRLIFLCARLKINESIQDEILNLLNGPLNWNKIIAISSHQEILPFLYYNLNRLNLQDFVPEKMFAIMKNYHYSNLIRNSLLEKEASLILKSAGSEGITIIPFKGFSLLQTLYRDNPELRIMVDTDILIKEAEFRETKNILAQAGYTKNTSAAENKIHFETVFSKKLTANFSSIIEVHTALSPVRPYPIKLPELWERTQEKTINGQKILLLSAEDTFLSLTLHLRRHVRRLTLKFIVDIAELLNKYENKLDWSYIAKAAKNNHITITVYLALYLARELLDANAPAKVISQFRPNIIKRALINLFINKHNFFILKKWQANFLRFLLFGRFLDFCLYLWRVSFLERFIAGGALKKTRTNAIQKIPIKNIVETRK
ncbi:MAG: nucleotidyltransferase family protein [Candidatus Omnitrophota bacterium]